MSFKNEIERLQAEALFEEEQEGIWRLDEFEIVKSKPYFLLEIRYGEDPSKPLPHPLQGQYTDLAYAKEVIRSWKENTVEKKSTAKD